MPNYKTFQDYADSLRVRIYGADSGGAVTSVLTDASGRMEVIGEFAISGNVSISGTVDTSGWVFNSGGAPLSVSGTVGVSGSVAVSGTVDTSGWVFNSGGAPLSVSGTVAVSGNVGVSGTVAVSGIVSTSGYVFNDSGNPLLVNIFTRTFLDSGPVIQHITPGTSGQVDGIWDVLGYNSWTLAVKYSGVSGEAITAKLQMSAVSGTADFVDDGGSSNYSGTSWNFFTSNYHVRFARIYDIDNATSDSGDLLLYFQGEY